MPVARPEVPILGGFGACEWCPGQRLERAMVPCFCLTAPVTAGYSVLLQDLQALQRRAAGVSSPARTEMARFVEMPYTLYMLNVTPFRYLCRMRRPTLGDNGLYGGVQRPNYCALR